MVYLIKLLLNAGTICDSVQDTISSKYDDMSYWWWLNDAYSQAFFCFLLIISSVPLKILWNWTIFSKFSAFLPVWAQSTRWRCVTACLTQECQQQKPLNIGKNPHLSKIFVILPFYYENNHNVQMLDFYTLKASQTFFFLHYAYMRNIS